MSPEYQTVSLPESLVKKIDGVIESKKYGYTSRAELIKEAIRDKLKELGVLF